MAVPLQGLSSGVNAIQLTHLLEDLLQATNTFVPDARLRIARASFNPGLYTYIIDEIYCALKDPRRVLITLEFLEFLLKNGSKRMVDDERLKDRAIPESRIFFIHSPCFSSCPAPLTRSSRDKAALVREKAKGIQELFNDNDLLSPERKKVCPRIGMSPVDVGRSSGDGSGSGFGFTGNSSGSCGNWEGSTLGCWVSTQITGGIAETDNESDDSERQDGSSDMGFSAGGSVCLHPEVMDKETQEVVDDEERLEG
eukprot:s1825_g2.t1